MQQERSESSIPNFHVPEPPFQPHGPQTLLWFSILVTNSATGLQVQHSISLLITLSFAILQSRGTIWHLRCSFSLFHAQQRDLVGAATLTRFPWCHHHVACCSASRLNPAFLRVFPPLYTFTIHYLEPNQEILVQVCHEAMLRNKDNNFGIFSPLPAANHALWPWDTTAMIPALLDMTSRGSQLTSHRFQTTVWVKCPILLPGGWQQKPSVGSLGSILASARSEVLVTMQRAFLCGTMF